MTGKQIMNYSSWMIIEGNRKITKT